MPLEEYISNAGVHTRGEDVSSLIDIMCPHIARAVIGHSRRVNRHSRESRNPSVCLWRIFLEKYLRRDELGETEPGMKLP